MHYLCLCTSATQLFDAHIADAGHGYDLVNLQCAEFCVTSHHFQVNGIEHSVTYKEAGVAAANLSCPLMLHTAAIAGMHQFV
jgi:hypothetical protein